MEGGVLEDMLAFAVQCAAVDEEQKMNLVKEEWNNIVKAAIRLDLVDPKKDLLEKAMKEHGGISNHPMAAFNIAMVEALRLGSQIAARVEAEDPLINLMRGQRC